MDTLHAKESLEKSRQYELAGRYEEALQLYRDVIALWSAQMSEELGLCVAEAIYNQAMLFSQLERYDEEIAAYQQLVTRFARGSHLEMRLLAAEGLVNQAYTLEELDRLKEAVATMTQLIQLFAKAPEEELQNYVEKARDIKEMWEEAVE